MSTSVSNSAELVCLVPGSGNGTRLGALTTTQAKPALAVSFDSDESIRRMIDIPLAAVRQLGGQAIVSTRTGDSTMEFVTGYSGVSILPQAGPSKILSMLAKSRPMFANLQPRYIGIIPADTYIRATTLEHLLETLVTTGADAAVLATERLAGHTQHGIDHSRRLTSPETAVDTVADLGVHVLRADWLLDRLTTIPTDSLPNATIWDAYSRDGKPDEVILCVPDDGPDWVDMGTPGAFYSVVEHLNRQRKDKNNNIVFPMAYLSSLATESIALPASSASLTLHRVIVPEGRTVVAPSQVLQV